MKTPTTPLTPGNSKDLAMACASLTSFFRTDEEREKIKELVKKDHKAIDKVCLHYNLPVEWIDLTWLKSWAGEISTPFINLKFSKTNGFAIVLDYKEEITRFPFDHDKRNLVIENMFKIDNDKG